MSDPVDKTRIRIEATACPWQHVRKVGEDLVAHANGKYQKTEVTPYAIEALLGRQRYPAPGPAAAR